MATLRRLTAGVAVALCLRLPAWVAAGGDWEGGEHCPLLTPGNFDEHLAEKRSQKRMCLVMFHVSWCKVCQRAFPEFVNASQKVKDLGLEVDFAHVDCTDEKTLCNRIVVKGYPTIKLFGVEEAVDPRTYKSPRTVTGFVKYIERMILPPVQQFAGAHEFEKAIANETLSAFVAAVPSGKALPAGLEQAAKTWMDRHTFASSQALGDLLPKGAASPPADATLAVLSSGMQQWPGQDNSSQPKPAVAFYRGSLDDASAVSAWVERNRFPGVWALGEANFYEFTHANRRTAMLADDPARVSAPTEGAFRGAAAEMSEEFIFGVVDGASWTQELADFNVFSKDLPRILVTEDNFETWIEDIDTLRPATVAADLRSLADGAPILRQSRHTIPKIFFYYREAQRLVVSIKEHAHKGPTQAATVAFALLLALCSVLCICWCMYKLCGILTDSEDYEYYKAPENMQEKKTS